MTEQEYYSPDLDDKPSYQEIIELIDDRVDMKTDIIMESDWFLEQVEIAVKAYLENKQ